MKRGVRILASALLLACAGGRPTHAESNRPEFLALLHDGRFEAARRSLHQGGSPALPADLFFDAFTTYWQLVFDDENEALRETLDTKLDATIAAADAAEDPEAVAALWSGSSHLLLAELRAGQRRPLSAAFEAKKAKHLLESASIPKANLPDAQFGLGTYNYVADTVPSYVKGLRALLFLPKGDRTLGLNQLSAAAGNSHSFALEARTFLITLYASKHERQFGKALEQRNLLVSAFPDTIASSYASARLDLSLGQFEAAIAQLTRAEARARQLGDVEPVVVRCLELLRARAELASFRPDLAEATVAAALSSGAGVGPSLREDFLHVREPAARQTAGVSWPKAVADATPAQDAATFGALATAHPDRLILALVAGDAQLRAGNAKEALDWFARAAAAGVPAELQAGCQFRQGLAEDLLGHRTEALELYKRAAATPGFVAKDGAFYRTQTPYTIAP